LNSLYLTANRLGLAVLAGSTQADEALQANELTDNGR